MKTNTKVEVRTGRVPGGPKLGSLIVNGRFIFVDDAEVVTMAAENLEAALGQRTFTSPFNLPRRQSRRSVSGERSGV